MFSPRPLFPTLHDFLSVPRSLRASHLKAHPWNQSLLYHSSFSEQPADKLENSTSTHTQSFEKEKKFLQSCRICLCSHRSSEVGWMCTTGFWEMKLFGINERWPLLIKAVLSLCHDMFTLLDAAQVGRIFAHHSYVGFFCVFQSSWIFWQ